MPGGSGPALRQRRPAYDKPVMPIGRNAGGRKRRKANEVSLEVVRQYELNA